MPQLVPCPSCGGHVFETACACPHCEATLRTCRGKLGTTAAAAAMGLALTGCFGGKIEPDYGVPESGIDSGFVDNDGDGYGVLDDCDDSDPAVHPDATETAGDGVDSNCDGADDT